MSIPRCSLPVWRNLYEAACAFRDIACWEWMSDSDMFGVQNPASGEIGYCCVLGELGEVYGLVVYLGNEGLEQYRKIQSGTIHAGSPDVAYGQSCLTAWFGRRSDLDNTDLRVVRELGLKFRGTEAWPQFRSLQPGYIPWYLTETEATFLTLCLQQAGQVARHFEKDPDWLTASTKNHYLVRVLTGNADSNSAPQPLPSSVAPAQQVLFPEGVETRVQKWDSLWSRPVLPVKASVRPFALDEVRLQRIKKTSQAQHGIWEIDAFFSPAPVDGNDRPFFPYTFLCADHDSGFILSTVLAKWSSWETEFPKTFLDSVEEHKRVMPSQRRTAGAL